MTFPLTGNQLKESRAGLCSVRLSASGHRPMTGVLSIYPISMQPSRPSIRTKPYDCRPNVAMTPWTGLSTANLKARQAWRNCKLTMSAHTENRTQSGKCCIRGTGRYLPPTGTMEPGISSPTCGTFMKPVASCPCFSLGPHLTMTTRSGLSRRPLADGYDIAQLRRGMEP